MGDITAYLILLMQLLMNFLNLTAIVESIASLIGASHEIVKLLHHKPKINSKGGVELD